MSNDVFVHERIILFYLFIGVYNLYEVMSKISLFEKLLINMYRRNYDKQFDKGDLNKKLVTKEKPRKGAYPDNKLLQNNTFIII